MPKIILASNSPQRKKLLNIVGLKFEIQPSHVPELKSIKTNCADLVEKNALRKAKNVARKNKSGIVIGADTVVYVGNNQIVGKPKNINDARRILKLLFSRPQYVYTGVAVIDAATKKTIVDHEKTKVFMMPLTDKEIDLYHQRVNPFDKAGGFDIEGWGSVFINRIEGCYSNVIGLPMAKLATMLKKVGVSILGLFLIVMLSGCATEYNLATNQEESLMYGTEKEVQIGEGASKEIAKEFKFVEDVDVNERVERVFNEIVDVCDRNDIVFFVKVIDKDYVNAVSLPGGYVYIFKGLYDKIKTDDQLAAVLGHEIGHITAKHSIKRIQASYGALLLQIASTQANSGGVMNGVNLALTSLFSEYSQKDEYQADELGVKYLKKAGYDPNAAKEVLEILRDNEAKEPTRQFSYWKTHPAILKRISAVNAVITGKMSYKEYISLTE